jgi:hypothetical protein
MAVSIEPNKSIKRQVLHKPIAVFLPQPIQGSFGALTFTFFISAAPLLMFLR